MDPFALIVIAGIAVFIVAVLALGRFYPGSGADVVDWTPTRSYETEMKLEVEDIGQMLEAANVRRRARGERAKTQDEIELDVAAELGRRRKRAAGYRAAQAERQDLDQMLALANARRRRRGEPELTREQLADQLGA